MEPRDERQAGNGGPSRILIVEDEAVVARDIEAMLRKSNYLVAGCAQTGEQALALSRTARPDLVLMDIKLRGPLDGIEAARRIREERRIPVIYVTAYADEELLKRARMTEPYAYVLKPLDPRELHSNIEMALHRHSADEALRDGERQLRESLRDKEILLKETHHRVKNNLQVIWSLLNLQSQHVDDPATKRTFRESQNRIKSIALIHERLYRSQDIERIDMWDYVQGLAVYLFHSYGADNERVKLDNRIRDVHLKVDTAVPCGLIINELLTNALKYAFGEDGAGCIWVDIEKRGETYALMLRDDGRGLPEELDIHNTETLGMQLVTGLVGQLGGTITVDRLTGTTYTIRFTEP